MNQPNPAQLQALLQYAATKLGTSPEQLAAAVSSGGLDSLKNNLSDANRQRLEALLADRAGTQNLLSSPAVQEMLRRYT